MISNYFNSLGQGESKDYLEVLTKTGLTVAKEKLLRKRDDR